MIALYIILGIIAFFVLLLSIKVKIEAEYIDSFVLRLKWLFLDISVYPLKKKKPKKEKPKKEKPKQEEAPADKEQKPAKPNPFKTFYDNQGFSGVLKLITDTADLLGTMFKSFKKHFVIDDLYLWIVVSKNQDAGGTAIEYGNVCKNVYPPLGYICSTYNVKRYDVTIEPDFIGTLSSAQFAFNCSVRPLFLLNTGIAFGVKFLFKVVFKLLHEKSEANNENKDSQNIKGGATNE